MYSRNKYAFLALDNISLIIVQLGVWCFQQSESI
jgi:hypothetical protein